MYWKFIENFIVGSYILLQSTTGGSFTIDISLLQILVGVIIGLVPGLITAFIARRKWIEGEKDVVGSQANLNQTQAIENIAQAASMITVQAQTLSDKHTALIIVLEKELGRQRDIIEQERMMYENMESQYRTEVEALKIEIAAIKEKIAQCAVHIQRIVDDLREGKIVSPDCLDRLESFIEKVYGS